MALAREEVGHRQRRHVVVLRDHEHPGPTVGPAGEDVADVDDGGRRRRGCRARRGPAPVAIATMSAPRGETSSAVAR